MLDCSCGIGTQAIGLALRGHRVTSPTAVRRGGVRRQLVAAPAHLQLLPDAEEGWRVRVRRATYWALGQERLAGLAARAGFVDGAWRAPSESGFFQPLFVARAGAT
ncbi:hypothetical protein [Streptomyces sp. NPDC102360]|uniref:hypothetical protein n=1 Tax=Streptomyces sp. NPDC102360 TaxID=3366160 RepID=UPI003823EADA